MKKFGKMIAAVLASVLCLSSIAFAEKDITYKDRKASDTSGNLIFDVVDLLPEGVTVDQMYGCKITFTADSVAGCAETGVGGGFIFSTKSKNWNSIEWGNDGSGKPITITNNAIVRLEKEPFFTATDISGDEGQYAQIALCSWWGNDVVIDKIEVLDKDGKVLTAVKKDTGKQDDTGKKATDSNAKTGDATSVAALAAVAALAMVGVVVTSKKKEA